MILKESENFEIFVIFP